MVPMLPMYCRSIHKLCRYICMSGTGANGYNATYVLSFDSYARSVYLYVGNKSYNCIAFCFKSAAHRIKVIIKPVLLYIYIVL